MTQHVVVSGAQLGALEWRNRRDQLVLEASEGVAEKLADVGFRGRFLPSDDPDVLIGETWVAPAGEPAPSTGISTSRSASR
jgi:hypothetical protein